MHLGVYRGKTFGSAKVKNALLNRVDYGAVPQLVEALRYTPKGRGFDSRWCHWKFSLTLRRLMSYISGAPILDVSRSHTTTQHSR